MSDQTSIAEQVINRAAESAKPFDPPGLHAVGIEEFLSLEIPPREMILDPIVPSQGLVMVYSERGIGKTYFCLGIAYAVAAGGKFLTFSAPRPRRVLYIDGEMPARTMQERIAAIVKGAELAPPDPNYLGIITPDLQEGPIPNLSDPAAQKMLVTMIERDGYELIIIDNVSSLCDSGKENEAESWRPMQGLLLTLRRNGRSVLFVHHAGKGGKQRGTSKKEDPLDITVKLQRPVDYKTAEGARFEVHFEKARGVFGDSVEPFEARLDNNDRGVVWTVRRIENEDLQRVADLVNAGRNVRDVAAELGVSKTKAGRMRQTAAEKGLLR
jgi:putative DNA primase/helicase